ncbi:TolC family protein [Rhodoplanes sp. Z2-YC6860]|uniref:TolC family protein n=1 Tax=Rhodoplanes sp. Z2-YC6860 TaxID=674703 RepID=UPI000B334C19|nr:TolC family protein [Rhodoplanes sp. Z2-YC6860]
MHRTLCLGALAGTAMLAGCASFSADRGMDAVARHAGEPLRKETVALRSDTEADEARDRVQTLLKRPLTADTAVQIALFNNRDLQAEYNLLGEAEAARIRASLPANPRFSLSRVAGGGALEAEAQVALSILSLATLPARADIATDRFHQAQLRAANATLRVAVETRRAYYEAVAARDLAGFLTQAQSSADAASQLAVKLGEAGTMNKLDQARNQVFYAEMTARLATARQRETSTRERLVRAIGLWGSDLGFRLPSSLPALPGRVRTAVSVEREAVLRRLDLQIARMEVAALAKSYGLTNATRFLDVVEVAGISKRVQEPGGDKATERGVGLDFEVPLFDFGETSVRGAEEAYMGAVNRLVAKAVNVRSQAREAYHAYRGSYDIARHYQREVLPLRKVISDETLLRYNAMQIDVFALLAEARERIASTTAAIEAQRDYWLADTNVQAAVLGGDTTGTSPASGAMAAAPEAAGHN